jgi:hypothetical protein
MDTSPLVRQAGRSVRITWDMLREEVARRRDLRRYRAAGRLLAAERGEVDHLLALERDCARSQEADRADRRDVDPWVLPLVELRGLVTRAVLRHRIARGHRGLRGRYEALGRTALSSSAPPEPVVGAPIARQPAPLKARAGTEAVRFGRAFWGQLRPAILPRAPTLAGLAVGWWIAQTYTDSRWKSLARSIGLGSGGTTVVSAETYRAMRFWLPLFAAAVCAYLGDRLAAAWREAASRER